ncbi:MAG: hypothetical protein EOP84_36195 [Verrucomicrobiaceae bacterium]|nr:MAG: hypothetical protein EOP84_36195 [Verrucomicrobiaceae bacterium]
MSHITGPGCVLVSLRFGVTPPEGPLVVIRAKLEAPIKPMMNVDTYVAEALEGVAEANALHGTSFALEEIEIVPDDFPVKGQVRHCARTLTSYCVDQARQNGAGTPSPP